MLYSKRKKMAKGGVAYKNDSARSESRPMPSETDNDSKMVSQNSSRKPLQNAQATDNITVKQAQRPSITPLSRPKMVGSSVFSVRDRDDVDKDLNRMSSEAPDGYGKQPRKRYDEEEAAKSGDEVPDMAKQHNNSKPPYKKAIEDQYSEDEADPMMKQPKQYAKGGAVEDEETIVRPDSGFGKIIMIRKDDEHKYADGGSVEREMMMQPEPEAMEERHASLAAAIMAKRQAAAKLNSDSDEDEMLLMAEGGEILSHDSIHSDNSSQVDLRRNAQEDANEEDQLSFNALRKENYSESEGLNQLNQPKDSNEYGDAEEDAESDPHDMVSQIMKKRKAK
ncbi:MAG: hypothetical protein V4485_00975 [Pseudomonadota bacterium]